MNPNESSYAISEVRLTNAGDSNEPRYIVSDEPSPPIVKTFSQLEWKDIDNLIRYDHELHQWVPLAPEVKQQVREQKVEDNIVDEIKVYQIKNPNGEVSHKTFLNLEQEDVEGLGFWNNVLRSWVPYDEFKKDEIRKRLFERDHPNPKGLPPSRGFLRGAYKDAVDKGEVLAACEKMVRAKLESCCNSTVERMEVTITDWNGNVVHRFETKTPRVCIHGVSMWEPCPNCNQPEEVILTPEEVKEIFIEGADVLKGDLSVPTSKGFGMLSKGELDKLEKEGVCSNCNGFGVMRDRYSAEIKSCPVCQEVKEKGNELQLPDTNTTTPPEESWRDRPPML